MLDKLIFGVSIISFSVTAYVFDLITYPLYLILQRPWSVQSLSKRPKAKKEYLEDGSLMLSPVFEPNKDLDSFLAADIDTMEKMLNHVTNKYADLKCFGTRGVLAEEDETQPNGEVQKKLILGEYTWRTYREVNDEAKAFGYGLRKIGAKPKDFIVIFAETRAEWSIAAHGCFKQNFTIVTLIPRIGEKGLAQGLNESEAHIIVTSHELYPVAEAVIAHTSKIKCLIYMEDPLHKTDVSKIKSGVKVFSYKDIVAKGKNHAEDAQVPTKNDIAVLMYTSGSTGVPKGVLMSHFNLLGTARPFCGLNLVKYHDVVLCLLPLSHVLELLIETYCLFYGVSIGYSSPLTVTDMSVKVKKGCKGDASVLRPHFMPSVPLILERFTKAIKDKVKQSSPVKRALFSFAVSYKRKWMDRGFSTPILDILVFRSSKKLLGGRIRAMMSGGAPCSQETQSFVKICLCINIQQGYGLTETTACGTGMTSSDRSLGRIGGPLCAAIVRLVDWEEGNYTVRDKPFPRGEIWISGQTVTIGYFKNPDQTSEDYIVQYGKRWFKTGDIAECHNDGALQIIDRKKDLVKLQMGEYVSLGKVETEMKTNMLVETICVIGDPFKTYTVALVVPSPAHLQEFASKRLNIKKPHDELCDDLSVQDAVLKELIAHGEKAGLQRFEIPRAIKLIKESWSPESGHLTSSFKLRRKLIQEKYKKDIDMLYLPSPSFAM